jgi:hypothetical protein
MGFSGNQSVFQRKGNKSGLKRQGALKLILGVSLLWGFD